jgi:hypothetical protein
MNNIYYNPDTKFNGSLILKSKVYPGSINLLKFFILQQNTENTRMPQIINTLNQNLINELITFRDSVGIPTVISNLDEIGENSYVYDLLKNSGIMTSSSSTATIHFCGPFMNTGYLLTSIQEKSNSNYQKDFIYNVLYVLSFNAGNTKLHSLVTFRVRNSTSPTLYIDAICASQFFSQTKNVSDQIDNNGGYRIMNPLIEAAKNIGIQSVTLNAINTDETIKFYIDLGFQVTRNPNRKVLVPAILNFNNVLAQPVALPPELQQKRDSRHAFLRSQNINLPNNGNSQVNEIAGVVTALVNTKHADDDYLNALIEHFEQEMEEENQNQNQNQNQNTSPLFSKKDKNEIADFLQGVNFEENQPKQSEDQEMAEFLNGIDFNNEGNSSAEKAEINKQNDNEELANFLNDNNIDFNNEDINPSKKAKVNKQNDNEELANFLSGINFNELENNNNNTNVNPYMNFSKEEKKLMGDLFGDNSKKRKGVTGGKRKTTKKRKQKFSKKKKCGRRKKLTRNK